MTAKKSIAIIGGGASALILASRLNTEKYDVTIYEKNAALGRKFLVAGKGGFNLTHSEEEQSFIKRYTPSSFIEPFFKSFTNIDFRNWLATIGIETYVGTSKRVFPENGVKPIEVLKAIEQEIKKNNVAIKYHHTWSGFKDNDLLFENSNNSKIIKADITIFALGGASWKITGSDGSWLSYFESENIKTEVFVPSNCSYKIDWNKTLIQKIEGQALKNCSFSCGEISKKGEAIISSFGIEGSGIYALSKPIREELIKHCKARVYIDFKPEFSVADIKHKLIESSSLSMKDRLEKKLHLTSTQVQLLKSISSKDEYHDETFIAQVIKKIPITIIGFAPIDEAISTVGGISIDSLNNNLELINKPNTYCLGEMINWDAPTGGYLLQACFSMGYYLADVLNKK